MSALRAARRSRLGSLLVASALALGACAGAPTPSPTASPSSAPSPSSDPSPSSASPSSAPSPAEAPTPAPPVEIVLMTHDSFAVTPEVLAAFTVETGITVKVLKSGDAGAALNQAILTRGRPLADVFFGVDTTFLSRALDAGIFLPYRAPGLAAVDPALVLDPTHALTPVDFGDVCVNIDRAAFDAAAPAPATLADLATAAFKGKLVVENPATSSPGLAFLLATIARFGEAGDYTWKDYWKALRANDVLVSAGWEDAYYGQFSGGSGEGERPLVVSYASSPVAEVFYADPQPAEAPTAALTDGCFRQVEFAGILAGTAHRAAAERLIDFLLEPRFQDDIPLQMFVFPVSSAATLPEVFARHATVPAAPLSLPAAEIQANRERWIDEWTAIVLR